MALNSVLYLDKRGLALSLQSRALTIHQDGRFLRSIPLGLIDRIVCMASVEIKTSLLANLADNNIGVSIFGGRHGGKHVHMGVSGTRDVQRRLAQFSVFTDHDKRLFWAKRLVRYKVLRQQTLLRSALRQRPDCRHALFTAIESIKGVMFGIGADSPSSLESLRGLEGAAARQYFKAYAELMPKELEFSGRNRRPPRDPVNALLSLGYTLLQGQMVRAIESVGLDSLMGLYHEPAFGRDSLASDLVELYRAKVDRLVWDLVRKRELTAADFARNGDACLLSKEGRARFYPAYQARLGDLSRRARRLVIRVVRQWQL